MRLPTAALCLACLLLASGAGAVAASLQISPVSITLRADQGAAGITLQNTGAAPIYGQVRVYGWDQDKSEDVLAATGELVASPPIVQIAPGATQTVRLVRTSAALPAGERSYRVLIDELARDQSGPATGVDIRLRYSVPVFVTPLASGSETLTWHTLRRDGAWMLRVSNSGARHAQIGVLTLANAAGAKFAVSRGLFGYVLAGRTREWRLPLAPDAALAGPLAVDAVVNSRPLAAASAPAD